MISKATDEMSPEQWWNFLAWSERRYRGPALYDFIMTGVICYAKPVLRFDHPGRKLADKYFSARLLGERRTK